MRISVVIPVKNDAEVLRGCLAALAGQSVAAFEVVVVDNGSDDASADVALAAGARLVRVEGGGIPAASAAGYDSARGDVVARLDADCVPPPDWLATIANVLGGHPEIAAVTGGADFIDGPRWLRRPLAVPYLGAYYLSLFPPLGHVPLFGSNCAFRRSAWLDVRPEVHNHDEEVHDDLDLSFHLGRHHRVRFVSALSMGMSMRPLFDGSAFARRLRRGFHTVVIHWPAELPWRRWFDREKIES